MRNTVISYSLLKKSLMMSLRPDFQQKVNRTLEVNSVEFKANPTIVWECEGHATQSCDISRYWEKERITCISEPVIKMASTTHFTPSLPAEAFSIHKLLQVQ